MQTQDAYNNWAQTYDSVVNKTRDLEREAISSVLNNIKATHILELGCGTGKNTEWLAEKCNHLTATDFSENMLQVAQQKINNSKVSFIKADITKPWHFNEADLITCSLVLEHIEDLTFIFNQAAATLVSGGQFYICELHPYKQLQGSRAKFEHEGELLHLEYFVHHVSDYFNAAIKAGLVFSDLQEWFDDRDRSQTPRLLSCLFTKQ